MKTKKKRVLQAKIHRPALNLVIDIHDYRMALGVGMILGMLIVGLPQLLGVGLLLSLLVLTLKLVEKDRL